MISYKGTPKYNALLYWKDTSPKASRNSYFASYLAISPVEVKSHDGVELELSVYPAPIMVHEPIPQENIEEVKQRAVERGATLVDCGDMDKFEAAEKLREAIEEYLKDYLAHRYRLCRSEEKLRNINIEMDMKSLEEEITPEERHYRLRTLLQLTGEIRSCLIERSPGRELQHSLDELWANSPGKQFDMNLFVSVVTTPGAIADRIVEFYLREFDAMLKEESAGVDFCREKICALLQLKRLDDSRREVRELICTGERRKAFERLRDVYKVKEENPGFCSEDDLTTFTRLLMRDGNEYDELTGLYIRKYLCVISEDFEVAQQLRCQILERERAL